MSAAAQSLSGTVVGDYEVERQIGTGSFSVVWLGKHRVHNTEVAIKEIPTSRLSRKLRDSLMSEIFILKRINHPNIICLHDIIEAPGRINIVLEYCKGGDLSMYLQRRGKVPESIAKNFMKQLAAGLQVLRDNNLIHRDLKPQNLLLSTKGNDSVLKIADFGFARPLQPRGLAETLCGSPLYMAPEIMQLQKYDAKADLWSVGAILFQLITGKTPFTGSNQIQLLQNILKSSELKFPPDCGDLSSECKDLCQKLLRRNPVERLTFDEFFNHPFFSERKMDDSIRYPESTQGALPSKFHDDLGMPESTQGDYGEENAAEDCLPFILDDVKKGPDVFLKAGSGQISDEQRLARSRSKVMESTEMVDGYVIVSSPPPNEGSSSGSGSRGKWRKSPKGKSVLSTGLPRREELGIAVEMREGDERAVDGRGRVRALGEWASELGELVREKMGGEKRVEALAIQLVILAIRKQALGICHAWEPSEENTESRKAIEREFLREVERGEEVARGIEPGGSPMPDAMEIIFQCALALGRNGGVDELIGNGDTARLHYRRAANLLLFLLEEAPSLNLKPPFSLTASDRYRLITYVRVLTNRRFSFPDASPP